MTAGHSGDQTAWGAAAEVGSALASIGKTKSKGDAKKKKKDDGFQQVAQKGKGGKVQTGGNQKKSQPVVGVCSQQRHTRAQSHTNTNTERCLRRASVELVAEGQVEVEEEGQGGEGEEGKEGEEGEGGGEHHAAPVHPAGLQAEGMTTSARPARPPTHTHTRPHAQQAVNRATECMEETDPEERVKIMKEDFEHYAGLVMEDTGAPHEDAHIIALHEVLRGITKAKEQEDRTLFVTYLEALVEAEVIGKQDVLRASAWFLETAAVMRIVEDTPFVYKRVVEAFLVLTDFPQMMKVLQMAFKGTTQWFEGQEADLQMVESVDELHEELATSVFEAYMKEVEVEENIVGRKVLDLIMTNMHKAGSPKMMDGKTTFLFMVETVLRLNIVDNTALSSFYANLQKDPTKSRHSMIPPSLLFPSR